jgi:hypothetical protein
VASLSSSLGGQLRLHSIIVADETGELKVDEAAEQGDEADEARSAAMLIAGVVAFGAPPFPSSNAFAGGVLFWVFVPIGGLLIALARLRASQAWRKGRSR